MAAAGLVARVAFEAGDPLVVVDLARRGLGVAVVPATAAERVHALRITPPVRSRLALVWRADAALAPAAAALLSRVRQAF
jgi:DNA-binding transcriptional LysR family regulator